LLFERRWYHRGQPVYVEGKDISTYPAIITAIGIESVKRSLKMLYTCFADSAFTYFADFRQEDTRWGQVQNQPLPTGTRYLLNQAASALNHCVSSYFVNIDCKLNY
jgi:hypothetical protein